MAALFSQPIDLWDDCRLCDVVDYLRGLVDLPPSWPEDW